MPSTSRREFLHMMAVATGAATVAACAPKAQTAPAVPASTPPIPESPEESMTEPTPDLAVAAMAIPLSRPTDWDPIAFNLARGLAGAIPDSYHDDITGPDGVASHLGKHLPYVPADYTDVPAGKAAIMWGDADLGYARHPNAVPGPDNNEEGHWYNWIRVRKATDDEAQEVETTYPTWPDAENDDLRVLGGGDILEDGGRNTIYLVALPDDVEPGDVVRIHAHCLTHGEYVDFVTI